MNEKKEDNRKRKQERKKTSRVVTSSAITMLAGTGHAENPPENVDIGTQNCAFLKPMEATGAKAKKIAEGYT